MPCVAGSQREEIPGKNTNKEDTTIVKGRDTDDNEESEMKQQLY